jgi:hypothetical protein
VNFAAVDHIIEHLERAFIDELWIQSIVDPIGRGVFYNIIGPWDPNTIEAKALNVGK